MKDLGIGSVDISRLILPGNFKELLKGENVASLTESIKDGSDGGKPFMLNLPMVRKRDMRLIHGRKRTAAARKMKSERMVVRFVDCTDVEAELAEIDENLHRAQHSQKEIDAMRARRVEVLRSMDAPRDMKTGEKEEPRGPGRPAKAEVAKVAKALGVSKRTVQRSVANASGKVKPKAKPQQREAPPISTYGMPLDEKKADKIRDVVELFETMERNLRDSLSALTRIEKSGLPMDPLVATDIRDRLNAALLSVKGATPKSLCLWCKGMPDIAPDCASCGAGLYSTANQVENAPAELRPFDKSRCMVSIHGKMTRCQDIAASDDAF